MTSKKMTWEEIYKEFKNRHPNLCKMVLHWQPYSYATIILYLSDGKKATYNCVDQKACFIS